MLTPFSVPGFVGKVPKAEDKDLYTNVFWHGDNLVQGFKATGETVGGFILNGHQSRNDNFARQGFLVRLPRVCKLIFHNIIGQATESLRTNYDAVVLSLASEYPSVCFSWGLSDSVLNWRWMVTGIPDYQNNETEDVVAGRTLCFVFLAGNLGYGELSDTVEAPLPEYIADREDFIARHENVQDFQAVLYNSVFGQEFKQDVILAHMMDGTGPYASLGDGLGEYGWSLVDQNWSDGGSYVGIAQLRAQIESFFGL